MVDELVSTFEETFPIYNGFAIKLFLEKKDVTSTARHLHDIITKNAQECTVDAVGLKLRRLIKDYKSKKERKRDHSKLLSLLSAHFTVPSLGKKRCDNVPLQDIVDPSVPPQDIVDPCVPQQDIADPSAPPHAIAGLRGDCVKCPELRKEKKQLFQTLKEKCSVLRKQRNEISKGYNVKRMNFKINRKDQSVAKKVSENRQLKRDNMLLQRKVRDCEVLHKKDTDNQILRKEQQKRRNAEISLCKARAKINHLKELLQKEQERSKDLELRLQPESEEVEEVEKKKAYKSNIRLIMYKCLLSHVPVERAGELVAFIADTLNCELLGSVPGPSTVSRMAYELGVISDIQTAEALVLSPTATLAWDATSIDGTHVNEVHVVTADRTLYLQVGHLPGGKTEDYFTHIASSLRSVAESYALYTGQEPADILDKIFAAITCTLTDRAAVNHCVSAELSVLLNKQLIELNCNVHPLDGLASGTRKALLQRDKESATKSAVYGNDCRAANFIYCVSKLRYKAGKGDPAGFKVFLEKCGLRKGIIPRYVGNRLHILFHSAGIIFYLKDSLMTYLTKYCASARLRVALIGDFNNPDIVTQLRALGLLGKVVTGPWMSKFYKNEEERRHLEMIPFMSGCLEQLKLFHQFPDQLLLSDRDAFGEPLKKDPIHEALTADPASDSFPDIVKCITAAMIQVLSRQLHPYLEGHLSNPSADMMQQTSTAPLNNIAAERILGMFDSLSRKAPNATVGFVDGKVKAAMNNTLQFILKKGQIVQSQLLKFATSRAATIRRERKALQQQNIVTAHERQICRAQQRDTTARKKVEKEVIQLMSSDNVEGVLSKVDQRAQDFISSILKKEIPDNPSFLHVWDVDGEDVTYEGKIEGFKSTKKTNSANVSYKGSGPSSVPLSELITDTILGDLIPDAAQ